jgi:protein-S-isoprenylcysteine O-methyltransferase Ste14
VRTQNVLACTLASLTYGTFIWHALRSFKRPAKFSVGLLILCVAAVVAAVAEIGVLAVAADLTGPRAWAGTALYVASLALFLVCMRVHRLRPLALAHSLDKPVHLVTWGPYRWVRHPIYTAYLMSYPAGWILSGDARLSVVTMGMFFVYLDAATREEEKFARSSLAEAYKAYRQRTGMFFPNPRKWMRLPR